MNKNILNGIGVLGTNQEDRALKDREMLATFSCKRENFCLKPYEGVTGDMIFPRSIKDQIMLKNFNACPCKETFQYRGRPL